jgi:hypothetical protein
VPRRPLIFVCVTALAVAGVVVVVTRGRGDDQAVAVADPLAEALSYAPASSEIVASLDVAPGSQQRRALGDLTQTMPLARFAADAVRSGVRSLGLDADADLPSLLGGPLVVAGPAASATALAHAVSGLQLDLAPLLRAGAIAAVVGRSADDVAAVFRRAVDEGRLRRLGSVGGAAQYGLPGDAGRIAVRGADVVLAGTTARLTEALALRDRQGGLTRATFEARLGPLRGPALVRVVAQPRVLIGPRARGVPWVNALRGASLAVRLERPGLRLRAHLATDPTRLRPQDLPLAPGVDAPAPAPGRTSPEAAGLRGLNQTIHVLDAARHDLRLPFLTSVTSALDTLDQVKGPLRTFGGIDVDAALTDQLTGTTTITREAGGFALRAELRDSGPLRTALDRLAAIPDIALNLANVTELNIATAGAGAYEVRRSGRTFLRVGIVGNVLVVATDLNAGLRAIAERRPVPAPGPGALSLHAGGPAVQDLLVTRFGLPGLARLVLGGVGDFDASAQAGLSGVDVSATLALSP